MWNRDVAGSGAVIALAILAVACNDVPTQPARPLDTPIFSKQNPFILQAPLDPQHLPGLDAQFVQLAREIPGFGGMFYDESGNLNLYLAPVVQPLAAAEVASTLGGRLQAWGKDAAEVRRLVIREGEYDFLQLSAWHQRVLPIFRMVEGVVFTDADEAHNRLRIGIESRVSTAQVEQALAQLDVPREAVILEVTEPIVPMSGHTLQDRGRPVAGGLQIHFPGLFCTLGFNVRVPGIRHDFFMVNSHCTQVRSEVTGTPYWQNVSWVENSFIGVEVYDPPFFAGGLCPDGWRCRFSDAAGALYNGGVNRHPAE